MARLTYNTIAIQEPLQTLAFEREPEWNGPDYLWTRFRLHVRGIYNPVSTGGSPTAATTDVAIRHMLMTPRKNLTYTDGSKAPVTILQSPPLDNDNLSNKADAHNGPVPLGVNVMAIYGNKTWEVEFAIETFVNETQMEVPTALVSQRWTMEDDLDEDFFLTRTIRGKAIFRSDRLLQIGAYPDDFRGYLFHPIPNGFKRDVIRVVASEDGTELEYLLVDRQKAITVVAPGVTRIEAMHTSGITGPGAFAAFYAGQDALIDGFGTGFQAAEDIGKGRVGSAVRNITGGAQRIRDTIRNNIPKLINNVTVRVWGYPNTPRSSLRTTAWNIILSRLSLIQIAGAAANVNMTTDLMGKFVAASVDLVGAPEQTILKAAAVIGGAAIGVSPFAFLDQESLQGVLVTDQSPSPAPPNDTSTRGTYLARLAAQALQSPDVIPTKADVPGQYQALTPP